MSFIVICDDEIPEIWTEKMWNTRFGNVPSVLEPKTGFFLTPRNYLSKFLAISHGQHLSGPLQNSVKCPRMGHFGRSLFLKKRSTDYHPHNGLLWPWKGFPNHSEAPPGLGNHFLRGFHHSNPAYLGFGHRMSPNPRYAGFEWWDPPKVVSQPWVSFRMVWEPFPSLNKPFWGW